MSTIRLDWAAIRPLNGAQSAGFEELCTQLARAECPATSKFVRKGTPDGGVECYAIAPDGGEWGWQAKYFRSALGDDQWSEIDGSVATALDKHPRLTRYYVCVPRDLSDGRVDRVDGKPAKGGNPGTSSAPKRRRLASEQDRWDTHAKKWAQWTTDRGMNVEFIFWGSFSLIEILTQSQHVGRLRFWFDLRGFDTSWLQSRLKEALDSAGPRYTPEIHVNLPIAAEFEAFGRTSAFFDGIKAKAKQLRKKSKTFDYEESKISDAASVDLGLVANVSQRCKVLIEALAAITAEPVGPLPFTDIGGHAKAFRGAADVLSHWLSEREQEYESDQKKKDAETQTDSRRYRRNPFSDRNYRLADLSRDVRNLCDALEHAQKLASGALMLLVGDAGTGKTHLLCDVAHKRLEAGRPTILLMGQRFVSTDDPWSQALQQLDLGGLQAEEFVGALEAAAQAAGCRVLVLIDALNEGSGSRIWPSHLAAFLARLERSPWIGIVLSVRSSYEEVVIPEHIRMRAVRVRHRGFSEHEYNAAKSFFGHYGIELPSTPLLVPEFSNPLFLKTLCRGLRDSGERRVPKGFHGITVVFTQFLGAINTRLSDALSFNPRDRLVWKATEAIADALVDAGERWLSSTEAERIVNALLPGRDFAHSLYPGLVSEGILVEEVLPRGSSMQEHENVVYVAYERLADHLVAKALLDRHLDAKHPKATFAPTGPLAYLGDEKHYVPAGLLEALCVQVPERTGKELPLLMPAIKARYDISSAFRESIIWRSATAFSDATRKCMNAFMVTQRDVDETLHTLLTTAIVPGHPFDAQLLDKNLRRQSMAVRDAWWSLYLHREWGSHGSLDRIVDWAWSITPQDSIPDETVALCATTLGWILTTSNRFLRDRATKALVSLLSDRFSVAEGFVERFAKVNDPYVTERVFAVAYGIVMRSASRDGVGRLAMCVYRLVFAEGTPPAHILLRDYARGVVERASSLGAPITLDLARIRPPYGSVWPKIPTEDDIKTLLPDWTQAPHDSGNIEWSRSSIGSSVMSGDFARYIIGTNSSSTNWLSLRLTDPQWRPPPTEAELTQIFEAGLSDAERSAWSTYQAAKEDARSSMSAFTKEWFAALSDEELKAASGPSRRKALVAKLAEAMPAGVRALDAARELAKASLMKVLRVKNRRALKAISSADGTLVVKPPRFDLKLMQRYILWRVFDLGWTTPRFGYFDRFYVSQEGRGASKAERIGKKYQWIAYHEIMAIVADNFQYREQYREEEGDQAYEGPWQESLRDIDPSCTLRSKPGGTSWGGHSPAWWGAAPFDDWAAPDHYAPWLKRYDNLPDVKELLLTCRPDDGSLWLDVDGYFSWRQPAPPDQESSDLERGDLWYLSTGYLIREEDADSFLRWAEGVDFWGRWMPDTPEIYGIFLGEYGWSHAYRYFQSVYYGDDGWTQPGNECPVKIRAMAFEYLKETGSDCSVDDGYRLKLPVSDLLPGMDLRWDGQWADFYDAQGRRVVFDPTAHSDGPTALLVRKDALEVFLKRENMTVCWSVIGEKRVLGGLHDTTYRGALRMTGAYSLRGGRLVGFVKYIEDHAADENGVRVRDLGVVRTDQ